MEVKIYLPSLDRRQSLLSGNWRKCHDNVGRAAVEAQSGIDWFCLVGSLGNLLGGGFVNGCQSRRRAFQDKRTAPERLGGVRQSRWLNGEQIDVTAALSSAGAPCEDA